MRLLLKMRKLEFGDGCWPLHGAIISSTLICQELDSDPVIHVCTPLIIVGCFELGRLPAGDPYGGGGKCSEVLVHVRDKATKVTQRWS
jgi:hypothetical protein